MKSPAGIIFLKVLNETLSDSSKVPVKTLIVDLSGDPKPIVIALYQLKVHVDILNAAKDDFAEILNVKASFGLQRANAQNIM